MAQAMSTEEFWERRRGIQLCQQLGLEKTEAAITGGRCYTRIMRTLTGEVGPETAIRLLEKHGEPWWAACFMSAVSGLTVKQRNRLRAVATVGGNVFQEESTPKRFQPCSACGGLAVKTVYGFKCMNCGATDNSP